MELVRRLELPQDPASVGVARAFVRECCQAWGFDDPGDVSPLVASELVTNALVHAEGPVTLIVARRLGKVVVSVLDGSEQLFEPYAAGPLAEGGRGLELVAALAEDWGEQSVEGGKRVWAVIPGL